MEQAQYVTYGKGQFDPAKVFPIQNRFHFTKPGGGLWASRTDASYGWKEWCTEEDFCAIAEANSFRFELKADANIIRVSSLADLAPLPKIPYPLAAFDDRIFLDFEAMVKQGIDGFELCWYGEEYKDIAKDNLHMALYGVDCDSICVFTASAIQVIAD